MMDFHQLLTKMKLHYERQIPFVLYALPNDQTVSLWLQKDIDTRSSQCFNEPGFVFAPFDRDGEMLCISKKNAEIHTAVISSEEVKSDSIEIEFTAEEKERHELLVAKAIKEIKNRRASKIVVSRVKEVELKEMDLEGIVRSLLNSHPSAFRYVWFHPASHIWCGASPELLVKTHKEELQTISLAGTQKYDSKRVPQWSEKEIEEQSLVTEAIVGRLEKFTQVVKTSKAYAYKAGSLVHIRTDIRGILKKSKLKHQQITTTLHPTPAVCGTPRKVARKFIQAHEGYDRSFYTGFLGISESFEHTSQFYVNLRCMRIRGKRADIFVGGGITSGSQPQAEWEETQNKLQTMLQVLTPFL